MRRSSKNSFAKVFATGFTAALSVMGCNPDPTLQALVQAKTVPPLPAVSVAITDYPPTTGRVFKNIFVSNFSVKVSNGQLLLSSARDGLTDALKQAHTFDMGFNVMLPESNNNGFADLVTYYAGITVSQQNTLYCGSSLQQSRSNDAFVYTDPRISGSPTVFLGLRDCQKNYLGLDVTSFDSDQDGIPDYLELQCGLNPKNAVDANLNPAQDGIPNIEKCRQHLPLNESANTDFNKSVAYVYTTEVSLSGVRDFNVSNIPVLNGGLDNFLAFYITETDITTNQSYLFTAFTRLKDGMAGKSLKFSFWGTSGQPNNQELVAQ